VYLFLLRVTIYKFREQVNESYLEDC
jgi:hypothetical protein